MSPGVDAGVSVGLVGCGRWGAFILRDLLELGCRVDVVAKTDDTRVRATEGGAHRVVDSVDHLGRVDGVVVATPASTHVEVIDEVLHFGVPIFVEKPLATDLASVRRLADVAFDRIFVMHKWRYHAGVRALGDLAVSGALGTIEGLSLTRTQWLSHHEDVDALWALLPHDMSVALAVLGHIPTPRFAVGRHAWPGRAAVFAVLGDQPWVHLQAGSTFGRTERRMELYGTEGTAVLSGAYEDEIVVLRGDDTAAPREERLPCSGELPLLAELRAFVGHLTGGPTPPSSLTDELATIGAIVELRRMAGMP